MSFLKDFKEDFAQAVNELANEEETNSNDNTAVAVEDTEANESIQDDQMVNTLDEAENVAEEKNEINETNEKEEEEDTMNEDYTVNNASSFEPEINENTSATEEITEITKGTVIQGNLKSTGSINVFGKIVGDIDCAGKLVVTGVIIGKSKAAEIFANNSKIEGDIESTGSVKIGNGTVIIGNINATSAVIGGAIKGDIDVHGPVVVDATAVVQGDIKSRSVQINNGAAIEGHCSQCYSDVDYKALFDETFSK